MKRFRDIFRSYVPAWLADRPGLSVGFRILWAMIAPLDAAMEVMLQGLQAAWPGVGTPTALPLISRTRGIIRGKDETDEDYTTRLRTWLEMWREAGSSLALALRIHEYLADHPRVRVIVRTRDPVDTMIAKWLTVNADGSVDYDEGVWDWDSVNHPERAFFWSDVWIVIYPAWAIRPNTLGDLTGDDGYALGHLATTEEVDALRGIIAQWKAAHTRVRAVIWTSDGSLFDPTNPATGPDGTWGAWGGVGSGSRTLGGRNLTTCRYWEPR